MPKRFIWTHIAAPLAVYVAVFAVLHSTDGDRWLSHQWFFNGTSGWLGAGTGAWWARDILHTGGAAFVRIVAGGALVLWLLTFVPLIPWRQHRARLRRDAGFVAVAMIVSVTLVGVLKTLTNVPCPWDLVEFGGTRPYVDLLATRPPEFAAARCFPGSHSASGFALLAFYFVWLAQSPWFARLALAGGLGVGGIFAFGQQARGAHFLSHDLTSAILVWLVLCGLYALREWRRERAAAQSSPRQLGAVIHPKATAVLFREPGNHASHA
jgi:membrane-associated PAP2 superfamily phosphatase